MRRFHSQNLTDGELPLWRHGCAWFGKWRAEWNVFRKSTLGIGVSAGGYDGNKIQFHLGLGFCVLYISRGFGRCFDDRKISVSWHDGCLWFKLWCDDDRHRDRAWHRNTISLHVVDWIIGRPRYDCVKGDPFEVFVPMPEGSYRAIATPESRMWTRRFGIKTTCKSVDLRIDGGIPFSGKGENSWDQGDDGLWGTGGDTVEQAIGNTVARVLEYRRRYGYDSRGTGRVPALIVARPSVQPDKDGQS